MNTVWIICRPYDDEYLGVFMTCELAKAAILKYNAAATFEKLYPDLWRATLPNPDYPKYPIEFDIEEREMNTWAHGWEANK